MAKHKGEGQFPFKILVDWIPIFKSGGRYPQAVTDLNPEGVISQDMIEDLAASYDTDMLAPITTDHIQHGEAKGRVGALKIVGDTLLMKVKSVVTEFRNDLKEGKYLYPSVEIYEPRDHANPAPGRWFLKAVTFLGAGTPAVKGLYAGFKERWVISNGENARILCFCLELNNNGEINMTTEEIQKMIDSSLKTNNEALTTAFGETMKTQFTEFAKTLPEPKADPEPKPTDGDKHFAEQLGKESTARIAAEARVKTVEDKLAAADKVALDATAKAFSELLVSENRMTPAQFKETVEPRVVYFVEKNDIESLVAFRDSILSTTKKGTIFSELVPDLDKDAKDSGLTTAQVAEHRNFSETYEVEGSVVVERADVSKLGLSLYNEAVKSGSEANSDTMVFAFAQAEKQLAKGAA